MRIIGCDFHPSFQQVAMVDTRDRRTDGTKSNAGGSGGVLSELARLGTGRHGSLREHAVVGAFAG
jgi:hypothetical protein